MGCSSALQLVPYITMDVIAVYCLIVPSEGFRL